jgi:Fic family protein
MAENLFRHLDRGGNMAENTLMSTYPYLAKYKIPMQIELTDKLVGLLMSIAEQKPFLEKSIGTPLEVQLLRKAKIRAITYSNQIEGNHLAEEHVTALIAGKKVKGDSVDVAEVQNYHEAINYVQTLAQDSRPLGLRDICDIQKLVVKGQLPPQLCGALRTGPASIINSITKEVIEECPPHYDLPHLMTELLQWIQENQSRNAFAVAFACHFITVAIHPFADGNGRTVRLLQHYLLLKRGENIAQFVPSETSIMAQRESYYLTIRQSRELERLSPFIEFMAECFMNSSLEVVKEAKHIMKEVAGKTPAARHDKIIKFIKAKPEISSAQIYQAFADVPKRTIERDLSELVKSKKIRVTGLTRARRYSVK